MSSVIEGFEYDIFISYRHKDNKGDHWVTEFVNALKSELESTFKEDISIYFDENPHDGLLETHNVDKSLEGKLKCLIFIPIISQTYCDPKSFAWQHEFVAFNNLSKSDQFGRDIKLSNGNVASRILPIKIHDLDEEDKAIIEIEISGVLRAIDFIYSEPGVNRPLKVTDIKGDNRNKTDYRNQINKVANAIKEILHGQKALSTSAFVKKKTQLKPGPVLPKSRITIIFTCVLAIAVIAGGYFGFIGFAVPDEPFKHKSIAVLAFADLSKEQDLQYLGDGIAEEIINELSKNKDLKVIARSSSFQFKGKNEDLREIGRKLGVSVVLEGSVRKFEGQTRVTAQLINVLDGSHYWSKSMDKKTENLFEIQDGIAKEVAIALQTPLVEQRTITQKRLWNENALRLYQQGRFFYDRSAEGDMERATKLFRESVAIDSSQAIPFVYLAYSLINVNKVDSSIRFAVKAKQLEASLPEVRATMAGIHLRRLQFRKAFDELDTALKSNTSSALLLRAAATFCYITGSPKEGVLLARHAVDVDPLAGRSYLVLCNALWYDRDYSALLHTARRAVEIFPGNETFEGWRARALIMTGNFNEASKAASQVEDNDRLWLLLYFKQNDTKKLDSMLAVRNLNVLSNNEKMEYYVAKNEHEKAVKILRSSTILFGEIFQLRSSPLLRSMEHDSDYQKVIKQLDFKEETLGPNWK